MAYACYALKCAIAPEIPNNAASLAPFRISAPEGSILNAKHPAPVALRHVGLDSRIGEPASANPRHEAETCPAT